MCNRLTQGFGQQFLTEVVPKALASHEFGSSRQSTPPVNWICSREKSLALSSIQEFKRDLPPDLCFTCQEPISWRTHFSSRKVAIFNVCEACFVDGRFPADITSKDFIRVQGLIGKKEPKTLKENLKMISEWTEEETLKLLDGIEEFGDRWDRISEFVGTKSAKACLYQFLQFSIEDDLYKPGHDEDSENKSHSLLWETYAGQSPNPLMTLLSLLSTSLSPHVAAEAARAALEVAAEDLESDYIVFKGDQKPSTSKLELEHTTRRAAERAFDASLSYTRSLIELEHQIVGANARILTEKQLQRIELKLALLEDVVHQSNKT